MDYTKFSTTQFTSAVTVSYDSGLRAYMIAVYRNMGLALGITALVAFIVSQSHHLMSILFGTPLIYVIMIAPIGVAIYMSSRFQQLSLQGARACFWMYAGLVGLSFSSLLIVYTNESVASAFFITASLFGAMSIYGYTTKKDLTAMGSFMIMGVIGIIIASLINIFLKATVLQFIISAISVIVFTGLTAYDTQRIKDIYYQTSNSAEESLAAKVAVYGAFALYLDFINLFVALLQFVGDRRSN